MVLNYKEVVAAVLTDLTNRVNSEITTQLMRDCYRSVLCLIEKTVRQQIEKQHLYSRLEAIGLEEDRLELRQAKLRREREEFLPRLKELITLFEIPEEIYSKLEGCPDDV